MKTVVEYCDIISVNIWVINGQLRGSGNYLVDFNLYTIHTHIRIRHQTKPRNFLFYFVEH